MLTRTGSPQPPVRYSPARALSSVKQRFVLRLVARALHLVLTVLNIRGAVWRTCEWPFNTTTSNDLALLHVRCPRCVPDRTVLPPKPLDMCPKCQRVLLAPQGADPRHKVRPQRVKQFSSGAPFHVKTALHGTMPSPRPWELCTLSRAAPRGSQPVASARQGTCRSSTGTRRRKQRSPSDSLL